MKPATEHFYDDARRRLRALLALNDMTQEDLAKKMGRAGSTLSGMINRNHPKPFEDVSSAFPPALSVTARLFRDLAGAYQEAYDEFMDGLAQDVIDAVA